HHMATLSAELHCLHVMNGTVGALCADDNVDGAGHPEENCELSNTGFPFSARQWSLLHGCDTPARQEYPARDEHKTENEDHRYKNEHHYSDVRVAGVAAELHRQYEQPGEASGGHQGHSQHAYPVAGEQYEKGSFWIVAHCRYPQGSREEVV